MAAATVGLLAVIAGLLSAAPPALAADASQFDPGNIISDYRFFDGGAMSTEQVQQFLNSKVSQCRAGYTCLKDYRQSTWTRPTDPMCSAYIGQANETAAQIITRVGQVCGVSQRVLLVLLEKEMSLVTDTWPEAWQYEKATGYACPDTAPCDAEFAGFYNQVYKAAWQYKRYSNPPGTSRTYTWFPVGQVSNVRFHPRVECGTSPVLIRNQATAGLYYYTPYQPNATAMSNVYGGQTDGCSSYGNRNFWRLYTDWFGSPTNPVDPIGSVDAITPAPGGITVRGWTLDFDTTDPIAAHVYVDGVGVATRADRARPDVASVYYRPNAALGFSLDVPAAPGAHQVCVFGINVGPGGNSRLGCSTVVVSDGSPFGSVDDVSAVGPTVSVGGWAIDPDTAAAIPVHVYVDGAGYPLQADGARPDVAGVFPSYGTRHGYAASFTLARGPHQICAYAINQGAGRNVLLGCRTVQVTVTGEDLGRSPVGNIDAVTANRNSLTVSGWTLDPDTANGIDVTVSVDGVPSTIRADRSRPDIASAFPGYGGAHGFETTIAAAPGVRNVCVTGINAGTGPNANLGCRSVRVLASDPIGSIDVARGGIGVVEVSGWVATPQVPTPIWAHVYVGTSGLPVLADLPRPDVQAAVAGTGPQTGFQVTVPSATGPVDVCVYAVDPGNSVQSVIGCRRVVVQ
ncbi:hypothetical protein DDQ50_05150 [Amnibacterium flavum]|uniref:Hemagglutinin n=1 Tax=Amnibacterium flavum TaxID=2173173 RepID=A0A2V1HVR7_9MICO|nr:hypothetical protein DDQ50_05150 [Amnibacterium flavum]